MRDARILFKTNIVGRIVYLWINNKNAWQKIKMYGHRIVISYQVLLHQGKQTEVV